MHYLQCCWECSRAKRKHTVGRLMQRRTTTAEFVFWRHSEEPSRRISHGFPWHHSKCRLRTQVRLLGGNRIVLSERNQILTKQDILFFKGTKQHKGSAPSINKSNFPNFALFREPAYRSFVNYYLLSPEKSLSSQPLL